jgi:fructose-1,6-bisphosphatase/inositol monophosphatase family enzyme
VLEFNVPQQLKPIVRAMCWVLHKPAQPPRKNAITLQSASSYLIDTDALVFKDLSKPKELAHAAVQRRIIRMKRKKKTSVSEIISVGIRVIRQVVKQVIGDVRDDPETSLESLLIGRRAKPALRVDVNAEDTFKRELHKYQNGKFKHIKVYGEESLRNKSLDLSSKKELAALVDAVDGTDLVERGLSNWCSAAVIFNPRNPEGKRLVAAFVGLPSTDVYYATSESPEASVRRGSANFPLAGLSKVKSIKQASICFYGQKAGNFLSVAQGAFSGNLKRLNDQVKDEGHKLDLRIYNLAGIPMMMKLSDHNVSHARGVDAVIELEGQKPHDFVPGAFIAKKAGAVIRHLDGSDISFEEMEVLLMRPASTEIKYVVASTRKLSDELLNLIKSHNGQ